MQKMSLIFATLASALILSGCCAHKTANVETGPAPAATTQTTTAPAPVHHDYKGEER